MNNRLGLGLAVGAGYLLGRTKKAKLAFGIGTLVMGKRLQLSPRAIADFAAAQLADNPQFKEIGDQLREDLRGVGKAATGALLNRQLEGMADRLHDRTQGVQDRISGVVPEISGSAQDDDRDARDDEDVPDEVDEPAGKSSRSSGSSRSASSREGGSSAKSRSTGRASAKSASARTGTAKKTAKSVQRTAKRAPAKKTASRRAGQAGDDRG
ncbi:DNA primase [Streptomyces sp. SDr-06]|uniref:DNA primase n=1 Tax=Streptomyces sp. SDr-06 TaxID=2267702 RepID=UPI001CB9AB86|nr:DNA primase [Streptomyces sp. SDr-06]